MSQKRNSNAPQSCRNSSRRQSITYRNKDSVQRKTGIVQGYGLGTPNGVNLDLKLVRNDTSSSTLACLPENSQTNNFRPAPPKPSKGYWNRKQNNATPQENKEFKGSFMRRNNSTCIKSSDQKKKLENELLIADPSSKHPRNQNMLTLTADR